MLELGQRARRLASALHLDADGRRLGPAQDGASPFRRLRNGEVVLRGGTVRRLLADLRRAAALLGLAASQMEGRLHGRRVAQRFPVARVARRGRGAGQHEPAPDLAGRDPADARPRSDAGRRLEGGRRFLLLLVVLMVLAVRHGRRPPHDEEDARVADDDGQARQHERHDEQELLGRASVGVGEDGARADLLVQSEGAPLAEESGQQRAEAADPRERDHQHQMAPLVQPRSKLVSKEPLFPLFRRRE